MIVRSLRRIGAGFLGTAQVGLADDFHQPYAGAVEVDVGFRRMLVVQRLSRVLFKVQPGDADLPCAAVGEFDLHRAGADDRLLVLADLIAGGQVGIKIVLAVEAADQVDVRLQSKPGAHRLRDACAIDDGQHAGEGGVNEANLRVRWCAKRRWRRR